MDRGAQLEQLGSSAPWDVAVIGGGATGLGVALDAATRGHRVVLVEAGDFAGGTSSRSTKLVHGGVRYLAHGELSLVRHALHERSAFLANVPHLARPLAFVVPGYRWWEPAFYGLGLMAYGALAGAHTLGPTRWLSAAGVRRSVPGVRAPGLRGGVMYWDGQFDDARVAVALARTAVQHGACVLNHVRCESLLMADGRVRGLTAVDARTGVRYAVDARCVVNAAGVWVDAVRDMRAAPLADRGPPLVSPSQGVHLVVDREFLPADRALLIPRTTDGRVLFALPWLGKTVLGTTDTPSDRTGGEPTAFKEEVDFILDESARYLRKAPTRGDVKSIWVGLRPLVRPLRQADAGAATRSISREHTVVVESGGLVTVTGGKWTTYRAMAEDVLDRCVRAGLLPPSRGGATLKLRLVGASDSVTHTLTSAPGEHLYGTDAPTLRAMPGATQWLWRDGGGGLSVAMVRFAVRMEGACEVEDVLARRCRLLFLDARAAAELAEPVAAVMREELGDSFDAVASAHRFRLLAAHCIRVP